MTKIELSVTGTDIRASVNGPLTGGMVGAKVHIQYNKEWDSLQKILVCRSSVNHLPCDEVRTVLDVDTEAVVAHEVMIPGRRLYLGLEGRNAEGTEVYPTIWADCGIIQPGANGSAAVTAAATPEVWQQLLLQMGNLSSLNTDHKDNLVAAINEAMTKGDGAQGEPGRGIVSVTGNDDGSWIFAYDDGTSEIVSNEAYTAIQMLVAQHLTDKNNPHGVTAAQTGAAPAGYGLGNSSPKVISGADALDSAMANGWYYVTDLNWANFGGVILNLALMLVVSKDNYHVRQILFVAGNNTVIRREKHGSDWTDWCCENPPMGLGTEYRTTERWGGLPVYIKRVSGGTMPASGYKDIVILASAKIIDFRLLLTSSSGMVYPQHTSCNPAVASGGTIRAYVSADMSAYTAEAVAKYVKT